MTTVEQLTQVFNDNFVAYFRSHVAHLNIVGRNFQSDHALLNGIYEDLQDQIDVIGELLRSLDAMAPNDLDVVIAGSMVLSVPMIGRSEQMLADVKMDLELLKNCYVTLMEIANSEGHEEIGNYAQDRILSLSKTIWMLRSTLDESDEENEEYEDD